MLLLRGNARLGRSPSTSRGPGRMRITVNKPWIISVLLLLGCLLWCSPYSQEVPLAWSSLAKKSVARGSVLEDH